MKPTPLPAVPRVHELADAVSESVNGTPQRLVALPCFFHSLPTEDSMERSVDLIRTVQLDRCGKLNKLLKNCETAEDALP